jgi:hypothetical protein
VHLLHYPKLHILNQLLVLVHLILPMDRGWSVDNMGDSIRLDGELNWGARPPN